MLPLEDFNEPSYFHSLQDRLFKPASQQEPFCVLLNDQDLVNVPQVDSRVVLVLDRLVHLPQLRTKQVHRHRLVLHQPLQLDLVQLLLDLLILPPRLVYLVLPLLILLLLPLLDIADGFLHLYDLIFIMLFLLLHDAPNSLHSLLDSGFLLLDLLDVKLVLLLNEKQRLVPFCGHLIAFEECEVPSKWLGRDSEVRKVVNLALEHFEVAAELIL